jgi:serine/threonine-protein kinase
LTADGTPKITDFGLAKRLDVSTGPTQSGTILGTYLYMAPEQATGKNREVGPAADVWALGAILYECLTGRPPFSGPTIVGILQQVIGQDPVPPRLLNPKVERDLETICLHCLEKDTHRRYLTAAALADDLDRFLHGDSISIRSVNLLDRLARILERSNLEVDLEIGQVHAWGTLLMLWAGIVFATHLAIQVWVATVGNDRRATACYGPQFLLMGLAYWCWRPARAGPPSAAERRLWAVWAGYLLGCLVLSVLVSTMPGMERLGWGTYPFSALLTGLAFFVLGESHWGWSYALGLAFFALALLLPLRMEWAPLEFGLLWTVSLVVIGLHLRRLGAEHGTR